MALVPAAFVGVRVNQYVPEAAPDLNNRRSGCVTVVSRPVSGILCFPPPKRRVTVTIPLMRPTRELPTEADERAAHSLCLALLRVGFTEPYESPRTLVRSYRTVAPLPVAAAHFRERQPIGGLSLLHFRQVAPTWLTPALCSMESRLSSTRSSHAAATRPTHYRFQPRSKSRTDRRTN